MADDEAFATVADLEARWHALTDAEKQQAAVHIGDVTEYIKARSPIWQRLEESQPRLLTQVTCAVVRRIMQADDTTQPGAPAGVTNYMQTTGQFSEQWTYSDPNGSLYLRDSEKRVLGIGMQRAFHIDMAGGD